jgi:Zn finger protein HypA/HybF involved in hydrogenase expression
VIQPKPFKLKCSKCGYNKIVKPKSDVLNMSDLLNICPNCKFEMDVVKLSIWNKLVIGVSFGK